MSQHANNNSHSPAPLVLFKQEEQDIGTTELANTSQLYTYMSDNGYAINEQIYKEADYIKALMNQGLKNIRKYPYVLQVQIPNTPFGKEAWYEVQEEIKRKKPWGDTNNYRIIVQDEWYVFIIIDRPS